MLPQVWPWTIRKGSELPQEFVKYLSDPELAGDTLGGQVHWSAMARPVGITAGGLFLCMWVLSAGGGQLPGLGGIAALAMLGLVGWLAFRYWEWSRNLIFITGKRVITVTGIFTRNVAMLPLGKLTDMNYTRSPMGYLLGYGSFRMETAGQNQAIEMLRRIPDPDASYRHVQNLLFGRGTTDVILLDVKTQKPINVNWEGQIEHTTHGDRIRQRDDDEDLWGPY